MIELVRHLAVDCAIGLGSAAPAWVCVRQVPAESLWAGSHAGEYLERRYAVDQRCSRLAISARGSLQRGWLAIRLRPSWSVVTLTAPEVSI